MDREAWHAAIHRVAKSRTRLSDFTFHFPALEKEMATRSSVLACLGRRPMKNIDSILKSRDIADKGPSSQSYGFSSSHVWM